MSEVVYDHDGVTLIVGDCREVMPTLGPVGCVVTDPPYGETSLGWDRRVEGWLDALPLAPAADVWCFGSLRSTIATAPDFERAGLRLAQEVVWEKHNGSAFHADRFKRVHELAVHWYRGAWGDRERAVPTTADATRRTIRRKRRPPHTGEIGSGFYASEDGGPRLMRSVLRVRSEHGRAIHPTQKPTGILAPLITYSCKAGGLVLDPFAGSASTLIAARDLGRRAIGIEVDRDMALRAAERLAHTPRSLLAGTAA